MTKSLYLILAFFLLQSLSAYQPHFMEDPDISPDGENICFSYDGDIWITSFNGGTARKIVESSGREQNPFFTNDGEKIVYSSNMRGYKGIYATEIRTGKTIEINDDGLSLVDLYRTENSILAYGYEFDRGLCYYKIDIKENGEYKFLNVLGGGLAGLNKDDSKIIFSRNGYYHREAYTGSRNGEIWSYDFKKEIYKKLTETDFTERYPVVSKIDNSIYFAGSDGSKFQLYKSDAECKNRKQISNFKIWSCRSLSIADHNDRIVYEYFDQLGKYDPNTGEVSVLKIDIPLEKYKKFDEFSVVHNRFDNACISDNGEWIAFSYGYDFFVMPAKGGEVRQITKNQPGIKNIAIFPDNKTAVFSAYDEGSICLYKYDLLEDELEKISWSEDKYIKDLDRDGQYVSIQYAEKDNYGNFAVMKANGKIDVINDEKDEYTDNYFGYRGNFFYTKLTPSIYNSNIYMKDIKGKEHLLLLQGYGVWGLTMGDDDQSLFFTRSGKIHRLDLKSKGDFYLKKDNWEDVYSSLEDSKDSEKKKDKGRNPKKDKQKKKKIELKIDFKDLNSRLKTIIDEEGTNWVLAITSDTTLYYCNEDKDEFITVYKVNYKGENAEKIASLGKSVQDIKYNHATNKIYYIQNKTLKSVAMKGNPEIIKNHFNYTYNKKKLRGNALLELWGAFGNNFYDPKMHGRDWNEIKERYKKYLKYCNDGYDLQKICDEMIGEVNASHSEINTKKDNISEAQYGYLGCIFDNNKGFSNGAYIRKVFRGSTLYTLYGLRKGDKIISIDGEKITQNSTPLNLLKNKINKKITLKVIKKGKKQDIDIKTIAYYEKYNLFYDNWVKERSEIVAKATDNKVGYLHIRGMNQASLEKFKNELFAENYDKKALIIDVRNNGGGYTHDKLIEILTKKQYAYSSSRVFHNVKYPTPSSSVDRPLILLMNENSASDAEIFPYIFKFKKLGKVIGVTTSGYVIGTTGYEMMDGSHARMPMSGWYRMNGVNLEGNGVKPDIYLDKTFKDILNDNDVQLKRGIEEILKEI